MSFFILELSILKQDAQTTKKTFPVENQASWKSVFPPTINFQKENHVKKLTEAEMA